MEYSVSRSVQDTFGGAFENDVIEDPEPAFTTALEVGNCAPVDEAVEAAIREFVNHAIDMAVEGTRFGSAVAALKFHSLILDIRGVFSADESSGIIEEVESSCLSANARNRKRLPLLLGLWRKSLPPQVVQIWKIG